MHTQERRGEEGAGVVIASSAYQNLPTYGYHVLQRFTKETFGSCRFSSLRIGSPKKLLDPAHFQV